jgi:hypothetical protein
MSEIFVDTIRKTGGSLGTDIRVKNTSVYESDGGTSVTQNLIQGIVKTWWKYDISDNTFDDSLNCSGGTDDGTGLYTITMTNAFNSADEIVGAGVGKTSSGGIRCPAIVSYGTTSIQNTIAFQNGGGTDANDQAIHLCGSLA